MWLYIITIILVIAKVTGYFMYSWWWVVAPSILALSIGMFFLLIMVLGFIAAAVWGDK